MFKKLKHNHRAIVIIISCITAYVILLVMMFVYGHNTAQILSQRFDNSVRRCLLETAQAVEREDMFKIIKDIANDTTPKAQNARDILHYGSPHDISNLLFGQTNPDTVSNLTSASIARTDSSQLNLVEARELMLEVLARKYQDASSRSIQERIDPVFLRKHLSETLVDNGIPADFSYVIVCRHARIVERFGEKPFDFDDNSDAFIYEQLLFNREVNDRPLSLIVKVNGKLSYIYRYTWLVLPILLCMTILLILLIYTIYHSVKSERLTEIQKAFVKNMTHELKTPVASISLASEMLADPSLRLPPESLSAKARTINNEAKRLTQIIERVLQTSVLERQDFQYATDPVNLNDVVTAAVETFSPKVNHFNGRVLVHLNATASVIYADRLHITNVVFNLMDNAFKYRDNDRPLILEVVTRNEGDKIYLDFTDNGIGIDPKYIKNIFDKFYRVPTGDRHDVKGFGLGLNYVKHVVTHNGGSIFVESDPGVGSRFTLSFQAFRD